MTITLKDVPAALHKKLKRSAEKNKRSLNRNIISVLEQSAAEEERRERMLVRLQQVRALIKLPRKARRLDPVRIIRQARDSR
jgi:hypothetical protein